MFPDEYNNNNNNLWKTFFACRWACGLWKPHLNPEQLKKLEERVKQMVINILSLLMRKVTLENVTKTSTSPLMVIAGCLASSHVEIGAHKTEALEGTAEDYLWRTAAPS